MRSAHLLQSDFAHLSKVLAHLQSNKDWHIHVKVPRMAKRKSLIPFTTRTLHRQEQAQATLQMQAFAALRKAKQQC